MKKKAIVTAGTRGIGLATVRQLCEKGFDVLVTGTRPDSDKLIPKQAGFAVADFTDLAQLQDFAARARDFAPDILINNVGIERNGPFEKTTLEDFQTVLQVNLLSVFLLSQAALPAMRDGEWGRIVNVTSVWGRTSRSYRAAYAASKHAIEGLSATLADEYAASGVLVNCVAPGFINIDATGTPGRGKARNAQLAACVPVGRLGTPEEVAGAIVWLATENTYVSGQTLVVDGGFISSGRRGKDV